MNVENKERDDLMSQIQMTKMSKSSRDAALGKRVLLEEFNMKQIYGILLDKSKVRGIQNGCKTDEVVQLCGGQRLED